MTLTMNTVSALKLQLSLVHLGHLLHYLFAYVADHGLLRCPGVAGQILHFPPC